MSSGSPIAQLARYKDDGGGENVDDDDDEKYDDEGK